MQHTNNCKVDDDPLVPYPMGSTGSVTGICLVFNNSEFKRSRPRKGSEKDFQNIKKTFNRFGFMVVEHKNLKKAQMVQILQKTANEFQDSWHCFVCFFLSHGKDGDTMYDCENDDVSIREMVKIFEGSNCPRLVGKPKLFFVQMCRGNTHQPGVETDGDDDAGPATGLMSDPPVPQNQDVLIAFSTSPGYMAYRDTTDGSWFIHTLTQELKERGHREDILHILRRTTNLVGQKGTEDCKMCPFLVFTLVRPLIFRVVRQ